MADVSILDTSTKSAPRDYTVRGTQDLTLKSVTASYDGTSAGSSWVPALQIIDPSGFVTGTYPISTVLSVGATADVTWFPGLGGGGSGGGAGSGTQALVYLDTPDNSGNAFPSLTTSNGFTNVQRIIPYLSHSGDGFWIGSIPVPENYNSQPQIIVSAVVQTNAGAVRWVVGTTVVAAGSSEDTAFTDETAQNVTVPGTALQRFDTTFTITGSTPTPGATLNVRVKRNAANAGDTCTAAAGIWAVVFQYS